MNSHTVAEQRILVMAAVEAERDAVLRELHNNSKFDVKVAGVGPVAAAVSTAKALAAKNYDLVLSVGIGGGFPGRAEVGSLVVASQIIAADLGAETSNGFSSLDQLGFGSTCIQVEDSLAERVTKALQTAKLPVNRGAVLTVSTVTGTAESTAELIARLPQAYAEGMEGFGVAWAAQDRGIPILELRAISNLVGPRDKAAWRIKEALEVLAEACSILSEVL